MEKFLTRNSALSILAGIFIVAGAFWSRLASSQSAPVISPTSSPASQIVYQRSSSSADNLVNANSPENPSVLAYDDIRDKSAIYQDGVAKYGAADIKETADTNRASLLSYGLALTRIIDGYPFYIDPSADKAGKSPSEITLDIYKSPASADDGLLKLEAERAAYAGKTEELMALAVPSDLVDTNLALANSFDRISQLIANMEKIQSDQLLALNSARQYVEESKLVITILDRLNAYFKDKNIDIGKNNQVNLAIDVIR